MRKIFVGKRGFSMVELLVVIAIIGVLAGVGVPTYRRMVQKSRKAEAASLFGGIARLEEAFFAEYGAYGNNLLWMGLDPNTTASYYAAGFPADNACSDLVVGTGTFANPAVTMFPTGFVLPGVPAYSAPGPSVFGYPVANTSVGAGHSGTICIETTGWSTITTDVTKAYLYWVYGSTSSPQPIGFRAAAYGSIDGTPETRSCKRTGSEDCDIWTITETRTLTNSVDGTH